MILDNQMDELFNDRLRDYHSPVPTDMWERIMAKKKRDRLIWLFFALFAIGVLTLGLTFGHFILNHNLSGTGVGIDQTIIKHEPRFSDTIKASQSNSTSEFVQKTPEGTNASNKKIHQKERVQVYQPGNPEYAHLNIPGKSGSIQSQNESEPVSVSKDSNESDKNKTVFKKDSIAKKTFAQPSSHDSSKTADSKKPEPIKKSDNRKWSLDIYASPDYPIISPPELEQSKLSYSIGIKLNRSLGKKFSVEAGIQFSRVNIGGDDSLIQGATLHLMRLDLPVLAGYSLGDGDLKTTINGGLIFNLYSWISGTYVQDFFKANTGLSFYLGVNLEKRIDEKISVFVEPYYRYQLTPMTVSSIDNMKFIDVVGISIGARYELKK